jgi:iron(III) transport system ATP-binding protein
LTGIEVQDLSKEFIMPDGRRVEAVSDVSFSVKPGEFFFILGPSGCGKTTLLRLIAGFILPDSGKVLFEGHDVTSEPAHKRNAAMVFQNYALFPHLNVSENVAYGLRVRKVGAPERGARIRDALSLVRMEEFERAYIGQLSGGQQQRVALARALVIRPDALLLDEPLSNLDARLREEMRAELKAIHQAAGITTIYVTHDQKEAMSLADRIGILHQGRIEQVGVPSELYLQPRNRFVAEFVGDANLIPGTVTGMDPWGELDVLTALGLLKGRARVQTVRREQRVLAMIRPEWIQLASGITSRGITLQVKVRSLSFLGDKEELVLAGPENIFLKASLDPRTCGDIREGDLVDVIIPDSDICVIPE